MEREKINRKLKKKLKKERYQHTLGVMYTAAAMAMRYGYDINAALLAGLLHDCGKFDTPKGQIRLCKKKGIFLKKEELEAPALIHARLGAYLARKEYQVEDRDVLNAILYHTTGRPGMNMLEKIIYLSDYIEPGRKMIPGLTEVRRLAFVDLDLAVALCAKNTLEYLRKQGRPIDPMTEKTYDYYSGLNTPAAEQ